MTSTSSTPFFIVGSPRSGTTLLRFILSSHPRIYVPDETGFIPHLRVNPAKELSLKEVRAVLERIGRLNYLWKGIVNNVLVFYRALPQPTLTHLLDALYQQIIREHGAVRWGDKTPLYVRYIPALRKIFPNAQFIHVIRDGRDSTLSAQKKWDRFYMDNFYLLKNWVANVQYGRRAGRALDQDDYLEVRYETLVQNPDPEIKRVCAFLGESFHAKMLDHTLLAQKVGPGPDDHTEVMAPISAASVQRWKTQMSSFEKRMAHRIAGPTLAELGYETPDPGPFTMGETLKFGIFAVKYHLAETARAALYASGVLTLNRNMRQPQPTGN